MLIYHMPKSTNAIHGLHTVAGVHRRLFNFVCAFVHDFALSLFMSLAVSWWHCCVFMVGIQLRFSISAVSSAFELNLVRDNFQRFESCTASNVLCFICCTFVFTKLNKQMNKYTDTCTHTYIHSYTSLSLSVLKGQCCNAMDVCMCACICIFIHLFI